MPLAPEYGCAYNLACPNGEGRLAQWLERLVHTEEVGGSTPPSPTMQFGPSESRPSARLSRAEVAERQTRCVQGAVSLRMCGFKSLPRHQKANSLQHSAISSLPAGGYNPDGPDGIGADG